MVKRILIALIFVLWGQIITDSTFFYESNRCFAEVTDDDMEGFGGDDIASGDFPEVDFSVTENLPESELSDFSWDGFIKETAEYGYKKDDNRLSKLESELSVGISYKITPNWYTRVSGRGFYDASFSLNGKENYTDETLDENESEICLREFFIDGKLSEKFAVKAGRQIVAWGESDYSRINDIINPRDMKQPGLTDLEDARLPVAVIRFSGESAKGIIEFVSIHEQTGSSISPNGSDFDYFASLRVPGIVISEEEYPDPDIENTGFGFRATRLVNGGDFSFYAGEAYGKLPILTPENIIFAGTIPQALVLTPRYFEYRLLGLSGKKTKGSLLFKFESAYISDRKVMRTDFMNSITPDIRPEMIQTSDEVDQVHLLIGMEYSGISNLRLSLEAENIYTEDYKEYYAIDKNNKNIYFQTTYLMLNETLECDFLWVYLNRGKGNIARFTTGYDLIDNLNLEAGMILYDAASSESVLYPYKDQDRFFARIKYSF